MKKYNIKQNKKKIRLYPAVALLILSSLLAGGCAKSKDNNQTQAGQKDDKIKVVTTIFPQYDFVREIAGDEVELSMLIEPGEETHSYEPTPQDIIAIQESDLFIYVGGENDEWVEDILDSIDMDGKKILKLTDCVETVAEEHVEGMQEERGHHHEEEDAHEHDEDIHEEAHEESSYDEHVWTSPENAMVIVDKISEILCEMNPEDALQFRENTEQYLEKLNQLDQEFREVVENSERNLLLFGDRFPFRYFADAYNLDYYAAFPGCASDTEPSAATMAFLINKVKEEKIPVVLKMELSNDNIARAIAEATNAEVRTFYSCHNLTVEEFETGQNYLSMMEKNVDTLKEALN